MKGDPVKINRLSNEDIEKRIHEILKDFPVLKGIDPADYCCGSCVFNDIGQQHGWDAADAWDELQDLEFLRRP